MVRTDGFTKLCVVRITYWLLLLASLSSCKSFRLHSGTKVKAKYWNYDVISWSSRYGEVRTTLLAASPDETMAFSLKVALLNINADPSRFCWLEVWRFPVMDTAASADYADPPDSGFASNYPPRGLGSDSLPFSPWSQPCPRKAVPTVECAFTFTEDGDLQLTSRGLDGVETMVWNSNTSGLGATTLELPDYDPDLRVIGFGVLLLRDPNENVVWRSNSNVTRNARSCFRDDGNSSLEPGSAARLDNYLLTMLYLGMLFCGVLILPLL